ncbi:unnamed protein product, partial [Meganyctiphanes norvegica]
MAAKESTRGMGMTWMWVMVYTSLAIIIPQAAAQLDNQDQTVGVYLESGMVQGARGFAEDIVNNAVADANAVMTKGSIAVQFLNSWNETMSEDLTAILSMANCDVTHEWAPAIAEMGKVHIAITETGCPRIQFPTALSAPMATGQGDFIQLFTDLRIKNTIPWDD